MNPPPNEIASRLRYEAESGIDNRSLLSEAADELDRLSRWQNEALTALGGWESVFAWCEQNGHQADLGDLKYRHVLKVLKELKG